MDSLLNSVYSMRNSTVSPVKPVFDYKAAQQQTKALIDGYKENTARVQTLKAESAAFLDEYTKGMNAMNAAAGALTGGGADKLLYGAGGEVTEDTVKATVDAVQKMADQYNENLKMLNDNAGRGAGVVKQIARMADDPAAESAMKMVGMAVNKDGTLALDTAKMTETLKTADANQRSLLADLIGGTSGIAAGVQRDARAGLNTSAGSLIGNDVARLQEIQQEDPIRQFAQSMRGYGAYGMNNMAAVGVLMNLTA